jgi:hypothetical protein
MCFFYKECGTTAWRSCEILMHLSVWWWQWTFETRNAVPCVDIGRNPLYSVLFFAYFFAYVFLCFFRSASREKFTCSQACWTQASFQVLSTVNTLSVVLVTYTADSRNFIFWRRTHVQVADSVCCTRGDCPKPAVHPFRKLLALFGGWAGRVCSTSCSHVIGNKHLACH